MAQELAKLATIRHGEYVNDVGMPSFFEKRQVESRGRVQTDPVIGKRGIQFTHENLKADFNNVGFRSVKYSPPFFPHCDRCSHLLQVQPEISLVQNMYDFFESMDMNISTALTQ
jgi:hypothetical protein